MTDPAPSLSPEAAPPPARASVERKLALGFSLAAALLLGMAAICFWLTAEFVKDNHEVEHTHQVIEEINAVLSDVKDMETCQRAFTIFGNEALLREYDLALVTLPGHLTTLRELVADNPAQLQRLEKLTSDVNEKVERVNEIVAKRRRLGADALKPENITGKALLPMVLVRARVQEMVGVEKGLLAERSAERDRSLSATVLSLFCLGLLLSGLLIAIFLLGNRELAARRQLSHALAAARDQALEAARQKGAFLANMSHEIRTPLNGIVGMTGLMLDRPLDDEARDCAKTIETCAEALMGVINDILDLSKMQAGQLAFEHIDFDLGEVVDGTLQILSGRAADKSLELNALIRADVPAGLRGDPTRLRQVLLNLIGNAIKFTNHGEITLHVSPVNAAGSVPGRLALRFEVVDTGIGISEEARGRLFRAFSQADSSTTRKFGGTGLGLAISRELVGRMGGEIGVDSNPGQGSTFWFTADFELDPARPDSAAHHLPAATAALLGGRRLLIVDDNATNRRILQHQLAMWGLNHTVAPDAHRALAQMRIAAANRQPFQLVLLDMQMPGMDGLSLAGEIKADADIAAARLVLMTSVNVRTDSLPPTVSACLTKPVRSRQLLETLCKIASNLPAPAAAAPARSPLPARPLAAGPGQPAPRILLVDDNPINQKVAQRQLTNLGCRIETAVNGREALEALERQGPFDLVLMDCQMPELDGYEATRRLREREAALPPGAAHRQTVIAMTANAMEGDREKCLDAGMDDYLSKPVKQESLEAILRSWLPVPLPPGTDVHARDHAAVAAFVGGGG